MTVAVVASTTIATSRTGVVITRVAPVPRGVDHSFIRQFGPHGTSETVRQLAQEMPLRSSTIVKNFFISLMHTMIMPETRGVRETPLVDE